MEQLGELRCRVKVGEVFLSEDVLEVSGSGLLVRYPKPLAGFEKSEYRTV
jgi:hypothetical protein